MFNLFRISLFFPLKPVIHILKLDTGIPYLKKIQKICESHDTSLEFCWHQHFFTGNQQILIHRSLKIILINVLTILMMSGKIATLGLLKIKVFRNKGFDVIISVHGVTNKILSRDLNYIFDVVMWPKFGNSSVSLREVIITAIL